MFNEWIAGLFPSASQLAISYDNPYNVDRQHVIRYWLIPPEIKVEREGVVVTVQCEVRTTDPDWCNNYLIAKRLEFGVHDITETYLPPGGIGVDNVAGYLYRFKVRFNFCG